jgi:hypothetical protein
MTAPIGASKVRRVGRDDLVGLMTRWERVGEETSCKGAGSGSQDGLKIQQSFLPFLQFKALRGPIPGKKAGAGRTLSCGCHRAPATGPARVARMTTSPPVTTRFALSGECGSAAVQPGSRPQDPVQRSRPQVLGRSPGGRMTVRLAPPRDWPPCVKPWWDATASSRPEVEFLHSSTSPRPGSISR